METKERKLRKNKKTLQSRGKLMVTRGIIREKNKVRPYGKNKEAIGR